MNKTGTVFQGLKLGVLLQLGGIGPICMLLFQLPAFFNMAGVLFSVWGVALADGIYIILSVLGLSKLEKQIKRFETQFKIFSGLLLILVGSFFLMAMFSKNGNHIVIDEIKDNLFLSLFSLTILNPITILCFTGIFSTEVTNHQYKAKELKKFALGVWLATPIFLSVVVLLGGLTTSFLPLVIVKVLNVLVACFLIFWGIKNIVQKKAA